jgi:hypothetical protein
MVGEGGGVFVAALRKGVRSHFYDNMSFRAFTAMSIKMASDPFNFPFLDLTIGRNKSIDNNT